MLLLFATITTTTTITRDAGKNVSTLCAGITTTPVKHAAPRLR
jgi:hypothetical protein